MLSLAALTLATTARCRRALVLSCSSSRSSAAAACPAVSACCLLSSSASSGVNSDDEDCDAIAAGGSGYSLSCCSRARASSAFSRSFAFELWSATHISFSQWPAQGTVVVFNFH